MHVRRSLCVSSHINGALRLESPLKSDGREQHALRPRPLEAARPKAQCIRIRACVQHRRGCVCPILQDVVSIYLDMLFCFKSYGTLL